MRNQTTEPYQKHDINPQYDTQDSYGVRESFYGNGKYPPDWDARREAVWERQKYQCGRCGVYKGDAAVNEVHHVVHLSQGGANTLDNLVGILLFGSVARGDADRASDIDLLVFVDDDRTQARRSVQSIVSDLEDTKFDGNRYSFEVFVESTDSAKRIGDRLQQQFDDGITLVGSDELSKIRSEVYGDRE